MSNIKIINSDLKISDDFTFKEYYSPTVTPVKLEFDIPEELIKGIQYLRDYWEEPLDITSAYRPNDTFGFHRTGDAVDLIPSTKGNILKRLSDFKEECLNYKQSPLIRGMRARGVKGFGIEAFCVHLDYRPDINCNLEDDYGKYCIFFWENDGTPNGKSTLVY